MLQQLLCPKPLPVYWLQALISLQVVNQAAVHAPLVTCFVLLIPAH
jgi:hypothetical protein